MLLYERKQLNIIVSIVCSQAGPTFDKCPYKQESVSLGNALIIGKYIPLIYRLEMCYGDGEV